MHTKPFPKLTHNQILIFRDLLNEKIRYIRPNVTHLKIGEQVITIKEAEDLMASITLKDNENFIQ